MPDWMWEYEGWDPAQERLRESLCTLGNGYFATRGAATEATTGAAHYPGTYVAGCYDRLTSSVAGRRVENEDLVNLPNWLPLRYRIAESEGRPASAWLSPDHHGLVTYRQVLDLRGGTLTRRLRFTGPRGGHLTVEQVRLVHMGDPHLAAGQPERSSRTWRAAPARSSTAAASGRNRRPASVSSRRRPTRSKSRVA